MGRRSGGYGSFGGFSGDARLSSVDRPLKSKAQGSYPNRERGLGQFGSTQYPSLIESYNRDSDYKRWRFGQEYWFGNGKSWVDLEIYALARLSAGAVDPPVVPLITTVFPSRTSPERSWHVTARPRGAITFPGELTALRVSLDQSDPDPAAHRLSLSVASQLTTEQLAVCPILIGDQFEDSAIGPLVPGELLSRPVGSVALTLVAVDLIGQALIFDLSRQFTRIERGGRIYWASRPYDPAEGCPWVLDQGRRLTSSAAFECSCPDYRGRAYAAIAGGASGSQQRFPLPNAARQGVTPWEADSAGYFRQWRDLSGRRDRRRECKHIHAVRWAHGIPFDEPSDYPAGERKAEIDQRAFTERSLSYGEMVDFYRRQLITYDRWVPTAARAIGLDLDPPGDLLNPAGAVRVSDDPVFWHEPIEPEFSRCRQNDWWLKRGTSTVRLFQPLEGGFRRTIGGLPVLEVVEPGSPGAPIIVP